MRMMSSTHLHLLDPVSCPLTTSRIPFIRLLRRRRNRSRFRTNAALVQSGRGDVVLRGSSNSPSTSQDIVVKRLERSLQARSSDRDAEAEIRAKARAADAAVYDPLKLAEEYRRKPLKVFRRTSEILLALGFFAIQIVLDQKTGQLDKNKRMRAKQLTKTLTRLGPTFVKVGQGLSSRPDICPPEYLEELSQLQVVTDNAASFIAAGHILMASYPTIYWTPCAAHCLDLLLEDIGKINWISMDALPTFPNADAFACIERELKMPLESIFSSISEYPIAAASLGQVYKACLRYSGQTVAVKVQRPGIQEAIGLDFYLVRNLGIFINKYVDIVTTDVVALVDEFASRVYQELNYVQEAQNAIKFKKLYGDRPDVLVPEVFWDYTSGKVLTMDWVDGVKLNEQEAIRNQGLSLINLVNIGIQCSLRQLLEHGYFHADPHPGNLLATPEGKLAFLDFGMMSETPQKARYAIIGHVIHMVNRDFEAMAQDYYALDFLSPDVDVSPIIPALRNFFGDALTSTVSDLNFKSIVDGLGAVLYEYPFNVPAYYALILRSLTVLEGIALYSDPKFKVLAASYPYFAKRLLTDNSPYLRDALIELLFKDGRFRWNRLENLLVQGRKDSDFAAKDVLQPVLKLLLSPDGEELRSLVVKESVRVVEAIVISSAVQTFSSAPQPLRNLISNGNPEGLMKVKESEIKAMIELRDRVFRIWGLLQSSREFDPSMLQPIIEVLQLPEARSIGGRVVGGVTQRLAARLLQQLLR